MKLKLHLSSYIYCCWLIEKVITEANTNLICYIYYLCLVEHKLHLSLILLVLVSLLLHLLADDLQKLHLSIPAAIIAACWCNYCYWEWESNYCCGYYYLPWDQALLIICCYLLSWWSCAETCIDTDIRVIISALLILWFMNHRFMNLWYRYVPYLYLYLDCI